jgi:hypothetical protein
MGPSPSSPSDDCHRPLEILLAVVPGLRCVPGHTSLRCPMNTRHGGVAVEDSKAACIYPNAVEERGSRVLILCERDEREAASARTHRRDGDRPDQIAFRPCNPGYMRYKHHN